MQITRRVDLAQLMTGKGRSSNLALSSLIRWFVQRLDMPHWIGLWAPDLAAFNFALTWSDSRKVSCLRNKVMGQVNLVLAGMGKVADSGSFTLTSGVLDRDPIRMGTGAATANGALGGFVVGAVSKCHAGNGLMSSVLVCWMCQCRDTEGGFLVTSPFHQGASGLLMQKVSKVLPQDKSSSSSEHKPKPLSAVWIGFSRFCAPKSHPGRASGRRIFRPAPSHAGAAAFRLLCRHHLQPLSGFAGAHPVIA